MTMLADLAIRSSAIMAIGLILCATLRTRSAALRHAVVAAALFASTAVIPLAVVLPAWAVPVPASLARPPEAGLALFRLTVTARESSEAAGIVTASRLAILVWVAGFVVSGGALLAGLSRLVWIARRAVPLRGGLWCETARELLAASGARRPITILQTDAPDLVATFGVFHPRVLIPSHAPSWPAARIRAVLAHELAHVRRVDWLVQIGAEVLRTLHWFNPLVWIACARLRRESEQACDDEVLAAGVPPRDYASHLVDLARVCRPSGRALRSAMPMARTSTLERRIAAMLNPALDRRVPSRPAAAITVVLVALIAIPVAAFQATQNAPLPLAGSNYDPSGAVLPGVQMTLQDAQQRRSQATTDGAGRFTFPSVAPGRYLLEARLAGFRTLRQSLDLRVARDWDRAITLQVGELSETISVLAHRVAGPAGPSGAQPAQLEVGGRIRAPRKLHHVAPIYPESMREAGREGVVPLEAIIGADGSVTSVRVLSADAHPDFAIAAADAVRQWRFDPTLLNGVPVEVRMSVSVEFKLSS